jgi:hypothetical protein
MGTPPILMISIAEKEWIRWQDFTGAPAEDGQFVSFGVRPETSWLRSQAFKHLSGSGPSGGYTSYQYHIADAFFDVEYNVRSIS